VKIRFACVASGQRHCHWLQISFGAKNDLSILKADRPYSCESDTASFPNFVFHPSTIRALA